MVMLRYVLPYCFAILLSLPCSSPSAAQDDFKLAVKQQSVEWGKPIWLSIHSRWTTPSLATIDFSAQQSHFEVVKDKNEINQTSNGQRWRIRLYPRHTGRLSIAALRFNGADSRAINIHVTPPLDNKTRQPFTVNYQLSGKRPWLRQEVQARYHLTHNASRVVLAAQQVAHSDMRVIPLTTVTQPQADGFVHTAGWAIYPHKAGRQKIKLPALHFIRDGVVTHRFYPGTVELDVQSLPAYLPGNIPVGQLSLRPVLAPTWVVQNRLQSMRIEFTGTGIPAGLLPDIRHFFKSHRQLAIYPVERESHQTRTSGISSQHVYQLPFKATAQGRLVLPALRLNYFDPATGKLASVELQSHPIYAIAGWLLVLLVGLTVITMLVLCRWLYRWLKPRWKSLQAHHHALRELALLQSPLQFRGLTGRLSQAEGWPGNLTLRQWAAHYTAEQAGLAQQISQHLEASLYRGANCDVRKLRSLFGQLSLSRWWLLHWHRQTYE